MKRQKIRKFLLLISFLLFPATFYYLSPYLILSGGFSGIISGSLIIFAVQFITSLIFGRAFCGWICPAGCLQDGCSEAVNKKVSKKVNWIKYLIWFPWLLAIVLGFVKAGGVKGVDFFYFTDHGISAAGVVGYINYFFVVGLIIIVSLLVGRRGMCHTLCWMAPFMILGTKIKNRLRIPSLRLKATPDKCSGCGLCTKNCPMSLDVKEMVQENDMRNDECILCGECADNCAKKAIRLTFKR
ncbi:MAG: 4Fe-4S binding protein [Bacillota bacterium]|nr:4Fe-4S binding protein [Bacillota bacterium]